MVITDGYRTAFERHLPARGSLLLHGDAGEVLQSLPDESISCVVTSPPYWRKRQYDSGGIGLEPDYREYVKALLRVFHETKRVLTREGSLWLNLGDTYSSKALVGIPWRVALALTDEQGWVLRNSVVWSKVKSGMDASRDRLANAHEMVFHFVQTARGYYYDADAIRTTPRTAKVVSGVVISATGVSGVRYRRQIELSTALSDAEKAAALDALTSALRQVAQGELADFRMLLRGQQRATHSDRDGVSGRARELRERGFCILRYHRQGSKPTDVWSILPEDTHRTDEHYSSYPVDLCRVPILATCPQNGIVLDPFCGTGTTLVAAQQLGRRGVGIDLSDKYLAIAERRLSTADA